MYVDYTDLNLTFPKDSYPLLNIDKLVDNSMKYKLYRSINLELNLIK